MAVRPLGYFNWFGLPMKYQIYLTITGPAVAGVSLLAVYENRYYVLCDNSFWKKIRIAYIIGNYCCAFGFCVYPTIHIPEQTIREDWVQRYYCILVKSNFNINSFIIMTYNPIVFAGPMLGHIVNSFSQFAVLVLLSVHVLSSKRARLSVNTYQMQKKFMIALVVQSVLFSFFLLAPVTIYSVAMFFESYNQGL
uniref:G protein-coupled receptor n=1 Tax=Caenorhabditis tropicalis TaxID=1561998 RepID=A0A1I7TXY2_9PELO